MALTPMEDLKPSTRRRIRVAHVVLQLDTGGMEKLLVEFAKHADRERFDLRFLCISTRGRLADEIEAQGWTVVSMNEPPGLRAGMVFRLASIFRKWDVDVVHTHNIKPFVYAAPAARLARVRGVVQTKHGQSFQATKRRVLAFRLASLAADRVVCVSNDSRRLIAAKGVSHKKLQTLWNGIDLKRFPYTGPNPDGPAVMVARLSPEKDGENLLRAASLVVRRRPSFRLEIAGSGQCLGAMRDLVAELDIEKNVTFLGEVQDIPSLLQRASLLVLPSLTEGLSLTLLEAMATGLPVAATSVGGNTEVVIDGRTGLLVPKADPSSLAGAMLRILDEPLLAHQMGRAARMRVEEHFDIRKMVSGYEDLYQRILPGRRSTSLAS
jgi:glycosyltransferase involved in cell wall biosynthesis